MAGRRASAEQTLLNARFIHAELIARRAAMLQQFQQMPEVRVRARVRVRVRVRVRIGKLTLTLTLTLTLVLTLTLALT